MPVEIEAKMAVADLEPVRAALRFAGAERVGRVQETNAFFDTKDASLLAGGRGLRLRTNRDADGGGETHVITYKGPLLAGKVKSREEVELTVADAADATRLLEVLGYIRSLSFQKRRESWKLRGCKIELDELPHLGSFVEIEGPGEGVVLQLRDTLGLSDSPLIKTSYVEMLTNHFRALGQSPAHVSFAGSE